MSYYNNIKCVMYKKNWEEIQNRILTNTEIEEWSKTRFANVKTEVRDDIVILTRESTNRWDECTDEAVEIFMNYLSELNNNLVPFKFIRIGEGCGTETDIEELYQYTEDLNIWNKFNIIDYKITIETY